jgi:ribosomal-protein-alanine N-acetyltransferase
MGKKPGTEPMYDIENMKQGPIALRAMRREDADSLFVMLGDGAVMRHLLWKKHEGPGETLMFMEQMAVQVQQGGAFHWVIEEKQTGRAVGLASLTCESAKHNRYDLGYCLAKEAWGQGYVTQAVRAVLDYGFLREGIWRIQAHVFSDNPASMRVLQKTGFEKEGHFKKYYWRGGGFADCDVFAINCIEWERMRGR